jgi:hypothetical protein
MKHSKVALFILIGVLLVLNLLVLVFAHGALAQSTQCNARAPPACVELCDKPPPCVTVCEKTEV